MTTESGLGYTLRPPKSYTPGRKSGQPTVIVIHTTEGHEAATSAEDGASYDARRTDGTSTHFFVDQNSIVQCVLTTDEAHAARAHGNDVGIQIEICGTAGQTAAQWSDPASAATIAYVARLCAQLRAKYGAARFPLQRLTPAALRDGGKGFAGHVDCTQAWPEDNGTHTDPGKNFPWSVLFAQIASIEKAAAPAGRKVTMIHVEGDWPELKRGDVDPVTSNGTYYISRVQRLADATVDGDYGPATAARIKEIMANDPKRSSSDGSVIGEAEWRRLTALW